MARSAALALALALLVACGGSAPQVITLVRGNGPEPDSLDLHRARNVESHNVLRDLYECLTSLGRDGSPAPGVASGWTVSDDGRLYTFTLRPEARWSNGARVVAADFVAGLRRLVDPATASQYAQVVDVIENAGEIIGGRKPPETLGISAPDDTTVLVRLRNAAPYLPGLLSHPATCPLHREAFAKFGADFSRPANMVSNGAFTLAAWVQGSHIDLARNRRYWNDAATRVDAVRHVSNSDENAEYRRYRAGELHVTATVPRSQFEEIRKRHGTELHISAQLGTYFLGFNLDREPFRSKPGLRRALSLAIDRERLVSAVTRVGELPAYGWVPPGTFNYASQSFDYAHATQSTRDAEARRLYAEAGYGVAHPLRFELRTNSGEIHSRVAVAVAAMWKEVLGAEASIVSVEFKVLQQDIDARQVDVFRLSWIGDYNDAYTFAQYLKSDFGINLPHYRSAPYDALLERAAATADPAARRALLEQAERLMLADHPLLPLYFYVNKHLVSPRVRGWYDNVMNVVYSKDLELAPLT